MGNRVEKEPAEDQHNKILVGCKFIVEVCNRIGQQEHGSSQKQDNQVVQEVPHPTPDLGGEVDGIACALEAFVGKRVDSFLAFKLIVNVKDGVSCDGLFYEEGAC